MTVSDAILRSPNPASPASRCLLTLLTPALFAAAAWAQGAPTSQPAAPPDLQQFAQRLDDVHRGATSGRPILGLAGQLDVETLGMGEDSVRATLEFAYLDTVKIERKEGDRPLPPHLIRYTLKDAEKPKTFGRDRFGPWMTSDGKTASLNGRNFETDRKSLGQQIRFAQQMTQFMDPAAVARNLTPVRGRKLVTMRAEDLKLGRRDAVPCFTAEGILTEFPLYFSGGDTARTLVRLWMEQSSGRLVAVSAVPVNRLDRPDDRRQELVRLQSAQEVNGILLPTDIKLFIRDKQGNRSPRLRIRLEGMRLEEHLDPAQFDRPRA